MECIKNTRAETPWNTEIVVWTSPPRFHSDRHRHYSVRKPLFCAQATFVITHESASSLIFTNRVMGHLRKIKKTGLPLLGVTHYLWKSFSFLVSLWRWWSLLCSSLYDSTRFSMVPTGIRRPAPSSVQVQCESGQAFSWDQGSSGVCSGCSIDTIGPVLPDLCLLSASEYWWFWLSQLGPGGCGILTLWPCQWTVLKSFHIVSTCCKVSSSVLCSRWFLTVWLFKSESWQTWESLILLKTSSR